MGSLNIQVKSVFVRTKIANPSLDVFLSERELMVLTNRVDNTFNYAGIFDSLLMER